MQHAESIPDWHRRAPAHVAGSVSEDARAGHGYGGAGQGTIVLRHLLKHLSECWKDAGSTLHPAVFIRSTQSDISPGQTSDSPAHGLLKQYCCDISHEHLAVMCSLQRTHIYSHYGVTLPG